MIDFPNQLNGLEGNDNVSGLMQDIWLAQDNWFDVLQEPLRKLNDGVVGDPLPDELVRIAADHTFAADKGFIRCYTTDDTQNLEIPPAPGRDQNGSMAVLNAFYPGHNPNAVGFLSVAPNFRWIVLATTPNGRVIQLGKAGLTASVRMGLQTNTLTGDRAGLPIVIEAFTVRPIFYEGVITPYPAPVVPPV